jgi:hypothetical protein
MYFLDKPNLTLNFDKVPFADDVRDLLEQYGIEYTETDFDSADYYFDYYTSLLSITDTGVEAANITIPSTITDSLFNVYRIMGTSIKSVDDRKLYVNFLSRYTSKKTDVIITQQDIDDLSIILETLNEESLPIVLNFISRYDYSTLENRQMIYVLLQAIIQKSPGSFLRLVGDKELIEKNNLTSKVEYYKCITADTVEMGKEDMVSPDIISLNDSYLLSFSQLLLDKSVEIQKQLNDLDAAGEYIAMILGTSDKHKGVSKPFNISKEDEAELEQLFPFFRKDAVGSIVAESINLMGTRYPDTDYQHVLYTIPLMSFNNSLTKEELVEKFNIQIV